MVERDFYLKMKQVLESEMYRSELLARSSYGDDARRNFIVKTLYFLIGTRDFDGFERFLNRYYKDIYPFEYLKETTNMSDEEVDDTVYRNMLNNGFLFHVTPQSNVDNVISRGLLNLNDKYGCNLFERCNQVNEIYGRVKDRNEGKGILRMPYIITIPGITNYERDRFNNVFLTSNLDYALKTYGENGELSKFFLRDILWAFGTRCDLSYLSLEDIKGKVLKSIKDNDIKIDDKELEVLFSFLDLVYEDEIGSVKKSIVMVPVKDIVSSSAKFSRLYRSEENVSWPLSMIHEFNQGEIENEGSIHPENLMVIDTLDDDTFVLKKSS